MASRGLSQNRALLEVLQVPKNAIVNKYLGLDERQIDRAIAFTHLIRVEPTVVHLALMI
jgi:hypothetical protein